jgi:ribosome-binding protein aMBF1 (putative translation factor)
MMEGLVEVTATERTRALLQKGGRLKRVHFVSKPSSVESGHCIVVALLSDLEEQAEQLQEFATRGTSLAIPLVLMALEKMPLDVSTLQVLALLASRLGGGSDPYVVPSVDTARRILKAHAIGAEKQLVASAEVQNGLLSVWSCEPKLYQCRTSDIPACAALDPKASERLEVSVSGSRIHWPEGDIDLDMEAVREFADPIVRRQVESKYRADASRYGAAIRKVREAHGLRQGKIPGLSEREVRRLEKGEVQPHSETLKKLAKAHGVSLPEYMTKLAAGSRRYPTRSTRTRRKTNE